MKKQLLAVAIAASLAVPQVGFAAEDDSGMQYTSASEGLFGSLRTRYNSGDRKNANAKFEADGSVFGYRGSLDLGNGLTGTYHYEQRIQAQEGQNLSESGAVRYNFVGLRGAFGEFQAGSFGSFVAGVPNVTDVTANGGGNFVPFYRRPNGVQYMSPELNGFQAGGHIVMDGGKDETGNSEVDQWAIAGKYAVRGFHVGGAYIVDPEGYTDAIDAIAGKTAVTALTLNGVEVREAVDEVHARKALAATKTEDATQWFVSGKYSQDNWSVAAMYGQKNTSDQLANNRTETTGANTGGEREGTAANQRVVIGPGDDNAFEANLQSAGANNAARNVLVNGSGSTAQVKPSALEDETYFSIGGSINVGKVGLAVLHDMGSDLKGIPGNDRTVTAFSATYNFTARSRVWAAYIANDRDDQRDEDDQITIGMRMDF